jgi:hypothetical protein
MIIYNQNSIVKVKERKMVNKKNFLGILTVMLVLVFGMIVVGCDNNVNERETNPSPPTGLTGTVISPNNSIQLSWDPVNKADEYIVEYKKISDGFYQPAGHNIKTASYTFTDLDYATGYIFRVAVINNDYFQSSFSSPISVETGNPLIGSVTLTMDTTCNQFSTRPYYYSVIIRLTLSDGAWWVFDWNADPYLSRDFIKSWVTMSGTPNVSSWDLTLYEDASYNPRPETIQFSLGYSSTSNNVPISGLTATIDTTKLTGMKSYTNVINSLSIKAPSSASSSTWVTNF